MNPPNQFPTPEALAALAAASVCESLSVYDPAVCGDLREFIANRTQQATLPIVTAAAKSEAATLVAALRDASTPEHIQALNAKVAEAKARRSRLEEEFPPLLKAIEQAIIERWRSLDPAERYVVGSHLLDRGDTAAVAKQTGVSREKVEGVLLAGLRLLCADPAVPKS